jgi:glycosyltransferase involved in cell wall biosynthesis
VNNEIGVSVILPCLNEEKTIAASINNAKLGLKKLSLPSEIIVIDNGSTDDSISISENLGARVVKEKSRGYGFALASGINEAQFEYILMADADDSYELENLDEFIIELGIECDLVIGNRFKGGIEKGAMPFLHQFIGNPFLSFIGKYLFKLQTNDFHCGMRAFKKSKILDLKLVTGGMEFASEMLVKASLKKFRIKEIPTKLRKDGRGARSHLRTWRDGFRHLFFLLILSPLHLFVYPGFLIILFAIAKLLFISSNKSTNSNLLLGKIWELLALTGGTIVFAGLVLINARKAYTKSNHNLKMGEGEKVYRFTDLFISIILLISGFIVNFFNFQQYSSGMIDFSSIGDIFIFTGLLMVLYRLVITSFYYFNRD